MTITYTRNGDYCIPDIALPEESQPIGKWGRIHWEFLKEHHPVRFAELVLSGRLWTVLADLNEQAEERLDVMIEQMKETEGVTEAMKASDPMAWIQTMNSIRSRAEEVICNELIFV